MQESLGRFINLEAPQLPNVSFLCCNKSSDSFQAKVNKMQVNGGEKCRKDFLNYVSLGWLRVCVQAQ